MPLPRVRRLHLVVTSPGGVHDYFLRDAERLEQLLAAPQCNVEVTDDPESADAIVFVGSADPALVDVRRHALFRGFPEKCIAFHSGDEPVPTVPGIYASVPCRWYDPRRHRGGFYLRASLDGSIEDASHAPARHLFSFIGAIDNHPVRRGIAALACDGALLLDSRRHPVAPEQARERFVRGIRDSWFVLCPRGGGTSSFRIFETMKAGRVPVILSDDWIEPEGPDWTTFSVRIPESEVASIPARLEALRDRAPQMGARARAAWDRWFSAASAGETITRWIAELLQGVETDGLYRLPLAMRSRYAMRAARQWVAAAGGMERSR